MRRHRRLLGRLVASMALVMVAACGSDPGSDVTSGGGSALTITSPDDGANVDVPFTLEWDSAEELGPPESGKDHVHVFVDGQSNDYTVVGGNEFELKDLPPGEHTIDVTLQHADHSPVGPEASITVLVGGGGGSSDDSTEDDGGGGYGY
jgi:hypothetical protein